MINPDVYGFDTISLGGAEVLNQTILGMYEYEEGTTRNPPYAHANRPVDESIALWGVDGCWGYKTLISVHGEMSRVKIYRETVKTKSLTLHFRSLTDNNQQDAYSKIYNNFQNRIGYDIDDTHDWQGPLVGTNLSWSLFRAALIKDINYSDWCAYPTVSGLTPSGLTTASRNLSAFKNYLIANANLDIKPALLDFAIFCRNGENTVRESLIFSDALSPLGIPSYTVGVQASIDTLGVVKFPADNPTYLERYFAIDSDYLSEYSNTAVIDWCIIPGILNNNNLSNFATANRFNRNGINYQFTKAALQTERYFYIRYSNTKRVFDDVSYHWELVIVDTESGTQYTEDTWNQIDLTRLSDSSNILRLIQVIEIDDQKDYETKAEAYYAAVLHEFAYLGFYFVTDQSLAESANLPEGTPGVFLPEIVNGNTTGNYFTEEEIPNVPYANSNSASDFDYNPEANYDINEVTETLFPDEVTAIPRFGKTYLCTISEIDAVNYNLKAMDWSEEQRESLFFGQNPYDFIINISAYPIIDYNLPPASAKSNITLGKLDLNTVEERYGDATGYPIMGGIINYPNPFGNIYVPPAFEKTEFPFLDYEPYTLIQLYLPYCQMVSIPPSIAMGKIIDIRMSVDLLSGVVIAYIIIDGKEYTTAQGSLVTEVPVSGRDYSSYEEMQFNSSYNIASTALTGTSAVSGNIAGASISKSMGNKVGIGTQVAMGVFNAVNTGVRLQQMVDNLKRSAPSPVQVSNGSASLGTGNMQDAYLYVTRPIIDETFNADIYKKIMGKPCSIPGKLSDFSGFTQMVNPILDDILCTAEEKQLIIQALENGVIL